MKKKGYLFLLLVVIVAFWQISFLQKGMKWDFVDAFLPSRYFFSESVLNNQFPLWNPYLLYGVPIFADLVSVFNPEFWIVANLFGYSNITLQLIFLMYVFIAGVSFNYFLKQFEVGQKLRLAFAVAYMLSGLTIGNAQHIAFVYAYAIVPFVLASYFSFVNQLNRVNFVRLSISLFLVIFGGYPGFTIILGYFLLSIFVYTLVINWSDKSYLKRLFFYHLGLAITVILFSSVLIVAYIQGAPFFSRYSGLSLGLALKHSFTLKSVISFILPMATAADTQYFGTDPSMSNAYFGSISLVLFLFAFTKKSHKKESYLILGFGIFALLASLGNQFFLREFLYRYFPLMNMFQYPSIFRGFVIFSFLAFSGINSKDFDFNKIDKKIVSGISALLVLLILVLVLCAFLHTERNYAEELPATTRFSNIILQGIIQCFVLAAFILALWKVKDIRNFSFVMLFLFAFDGIISTQLNIRATVISEINPIEFYRYLKSSPKGFPIPELNAIGKNSDKNSENDFIWMNNNVFPKKVTFDGLVAFKPDGYTFLSDNYPDLLEAIKKEPVVYFSGDARENSQINNFNSETIFLSKDDYSKVQIEDLKSDKNSSLKISNFSPIRIEVQTNTESSQLLVYQQNYFSGWRVFVDGKQQNLLESNFTHMAVLVPAGEHSVIFEFKNSLIKTAFVFSYLILFALVTLFIYYTTKKYPEQKKRILFLVVFATVIFISGSLLNRYFYQKNKRGLAEQIVEKTCEWKEKFDDELFIVLSSKNRELEHLVPADTVLYVDENTNIAKFSQLLMDSGSRYFAFAWQGGIVDENIKELLYSFYPKIVEKQMKKNSGLFLMESDGAHFKPEFFQDFEVPGIASWTDEQSRIKEDSITGNHSYIFRATNEWGPAIEISTDEKLQSLEHVVITADVLFEKRMEKTLLVFTTERAGKINLYKVTDVSEFVNTPLQWGRAVLAVDVKEELQMEDVIKIYFWNVNKVSFQIDNLRLKYIYTDSE